MLKLIQYIMNTYVSNMGGSPGDVSEEPCDVGEAKEGLENEL